MNIIITVNEHLIILQLTANSVSNLKVENNMIVQVSEVL